ncbi:hypothetical protein L1887_17765 [Cichorium endivia]|nr:hypothetical protein L1887_17765 [Cichorium endivia]
MERFREGRPLPKVLSSTIFEGSTLPPSGQPQPPAATYGAPLWRPSTRISHVVLEMESAIVSGGFDLNRCVVDYEKVDMIVMEAIEGLQGLEEEKWKSDDEVDDGSEEYQSYFSSDSIEDDDDDTQSSKQVYIQPTEISGDKGFDSRFLHKSCNPEIERNSCLSSLEKECKNHAKCHWNEQLELYTIEDTKFNFSNKSTDQKGLEHLHITLKLQSKPVSI